LENADFLRTMAFLCPVGVGLRCAVVLALLVCGLAPAEARKRSRGQLPIDDPEELVHQEQLESNGEKRKASGKPAQSAHSLRRTLKMARRTTIVPFYVPALFRVLY
jgi:hypothetical protein